VKNPVELCTERIILRQWEPSDYPLFAEMNASSDVMKYFPKTLNESESNDLASKLSNLISERGWGLWALEEKTSNTFIGVTGLHEPPKELSFSPATEIGWRLSKKYWGKGYVAEAAKKALEFAFEQLALAEIVSFTSVTNQNSQAVMKRINMANSHRNFMHPLVPDNSPLQEHVLYTISKNQWAAYAL